MQLIKSLLCFEGYDNGRRFLTISSACYLLFLLMSLVLSKLNLLVVISLLCIPLIFASAVRRIHDAGFKKLIAVLPPLIFLLCVIGITYIESNASWLLLVIAAIATFAITTISNARVRHNNEYIMGYSGPVDLTTTVNNVPVHHYHHERIEPTLAAKVDSHLVDSNLVISNNSGANSSLTKNRLPSPHTSSGQQNFGVWINNNQKFTWILSGIILIAILTTIVLGIFDEDTKPVEEFTKLSEKKEQKIRNNKIEMPDSFWVMLDQHNALTIGWQGDYRKDGEIWSALTAIGDQECFAIDFNIKDEYRAMKVTVKNKGDYYADFSPIDTKELVRSIANRDKFKLCGYEFSLKGTQAKLRNNKKYDSYFD